MDFSRIRLAANIAVAIAATSLISGLIVYCKGFSLPGLILMIAGIAVGIIAASILRMLSVVDNPWIVSVEKKSRRSLLFVELGIKMFLEEPCRAPRGISTCSCRRAGAF